MDIYFACEARRGETSRAGEVDIRRCLYLSDPLSTTAGPLHTHIEHYENNKAKIAYFEKLRLSVAIFSIALMGHHTSPIWSTDYLN